MSDELTPNPKNLPAETTRRAMTAAEFHGLGAVPDAVVWLANFNNPNTRRAYERDIGEFTHFCGIEQPDQLRDVDRAHVLAWRSDLEDRDLSPATIRGKLSALSSLFDYLCERNVVSVNPVAGVQRPKANSNEGKTPALSAEQARRLLEAPCGDGIKAVRDRAIIATYLFHGIRRQELADLKVASLAEREGIPHLEIFGKGAKTRYVPAHPIAIKAITDYLDLAGHGEDIKGPLFRPVRNNATGVLDKGISGDGLLKIISIYAARVGVPAGVHVLRATAATNTLNNNADLKHVQKWLGHAHVSTTLLYDRRGSRPEDSPTYKVNY